MLEIHIYSEYNKDRMVCGLNTHEAEDRSLTANDLEDAYYMQDSDEGVLCYLCEKGEYLNSQLNDPDFDDEDRHERDVELAQDAGEIY